jgi:hypothetical protein
LTGSDVKVISWLTDQQPGDFLVEFQTPGGPVRTAKAARLALDFPQYKGPPPKDPDKKDEKDDVKVPLPKEKEQHYFKYTAHLDGLPFNTEVRYWVKLGDRVIRTATFPTRATADKAVRCVLVGDATWRRAGRSRSPSPTRSASKTRNS